MNNHTITFINTITIIITVTFTNIISGTTFIVRTFSNGTLYITIDSPPGFPCFFIFYLVVFGYYVQFVPVRLSIGMQQYILCGFARIIYI